MRNFVKDIKPHLSEEISKIFSVVLNIPTNKIDFTETSWSINKEVDIIKLKVKSKDIKSCPFEIYMGCKNSEDPLYLQLKLCHNSYSIEADSISKYHYPNNDDFSLMKEFLNHVLTSQIDIVSVRFKKSQELAMLLLRFPVQGNSSSCHEYILKRNKMVFPWKNTIRQKELIYEPWIS